MTLRTKIFSTVGGVLLLFFLIVFGLTRSDKETQRDTAPTPLAGEPASPVILPATSPISPIQPVSEPVSVARLFIERYGSFSNQGNFSNIEDIRSSVTPRLLQEFEDTVRTKRSQGSGGDGEYSGVTTRALHAKIEKKESDDRAVIRVTTQRRETKEAVQAPKVFTQIVDVTVVRSGDRWLVDRVVWK